MELVASIARVIPGRRPSLTETISRLGLEFSNLKRKLRAANSEISKLRDELARRQHDNRGMHELDLGVLRRRAAYYCHPDRGGDNDLMSNLNTMFDFLEALEERAGGSQS